MTNIVTNIEISEAWGRIYAVIERVSVKSRIKANEMNDAASTPGKYFGTHYARIKRRLPDWADVRLRELLNNISPEDMDKRLNLEEQGKFFLGFYHEKTRLEETAIQVAAGRPPKDSPTAIDWSNTDWSLPKATIARQKGCTPQNVAAAYKRYAPQ